MTPLSLCFLNPKGEFQATSNEGRLLQLVRYCKVYPSIIAQKWAVLSPYRYRELTFRKFVFTCMRTLVTSWRSNRTPLPVEGPIRHVLVVGCMSANVCGCLTSFEKFGDVFPVRQTLPVTGGVIQESGNITLASTEICEGSAEVVFWL